MYSLYSQLLYCVVNTACLASIDRAFNLTIGLIIGQYTHNLRTLIDIVFYNNNWFIILNTMLKLLQCLKQCMLMYFNSRGHTGQKQYGLFWKGHYLFLFLKYNVEFMNTNKWIFLEQTHTIPNVLKSCPNWFLVQNPPAFKWPTPSHIWVGSQGFVT